MFASCEHPNFVVIYNRLSGTCPVCSIIKSAADLMTEINSKKEKDNDKSNNTLGKGQAG